MPKSRLKLDTKTMLYLALGGTPQVLLRDICEPILGITYRHAKNLKAKNQLPVKTYKMIDSGPDWVHLDDLANYIDQQKAKETAHER